MGLFQVNQDDHLIVMRDGVSLQCRFYFPSVPSSLPNMKYPVIVSLCADDSAETDSLFRYYSGHGLVCLCLFFRGRGESGGEFSLDGTVNRDLEDFFLWLQRQPWYGGRCGFCGSGMGGTFGLQFSQGHPDWIHALLLSSFVLNYDRRGMCTNGVFRLSCLRSLIDLACSSPRLKNDAGKRKALQEMRGGFPLYARYWPFSAGSTPLSLLPEYEEIALDFSRKSVPGSQETRCRYTPEQFFAGYPDTPVLLFGTWDDERLPGVLKTYYELSYRRDGGIQCFISSDSSRLTAFSELPFHRRFLFRDYTLGWFRHWLCGDAGEHFRSKKIFYQLLEGGQGASVRKNAGRGKNGWKEAVFWPPGDHELFFYLQKDCRLSTLYSGMDCTRTGSSFFSDPLHPVMAEEAPRKRTGNRAAEPSRLQHFLPYLRGDILTFLSGPLKKSIVLAGSVRIRLYLHCTSPDGDICCRLACLKPGGNSSGGQPVPLFLCFGVQRISCYHPSRIVTGSVPDYCRLYEFSLSPVAAVLPEGARLQLDISGSLFPRYAVSNQTGIQDLRGNTGPVAYYRIYHNRQCPSCMMLPVLPSAGRSETSVGPVRNSSRIAAGENQNKGEKSWRL